MISTLTQTPGRGGGRLVENVMHFCRVLRAAGLPVGPGQTLKALEAVRAIALHDRDQFYWALHAALVSRRDQRELFDQAFHMFWRNPRLLDRMMGLLLPDIAVEMPRDPEREVARRIAEAMAPPPDTPQREAGEEVEVRAELTWSDREMLHRMDFESMSAEEVERAKRAIAGLRLPIADVATRRFRPDPAGPRVDMRATLRGLLRAGPDAIFVARRRRRTRPPPLVVLCDVSGSMARYSRMLLHFLHTLTNDRDRVHTFLFGTRLTNVTRHLRHRDVDVALEKIAGVVEDWSGGTRIGHALHDFNRFWSRRVLGQGAVVLLITDGLDRDAAEGLEAEIERLHKSCRRLIWLNPLLRYDGFQPKSRGAQAILPHVDEFRPVHNIASLADLAAALGRVPARRQEGIGQWLRMLPA
ncbi:MAG: vWA domain-containing protein [Alphaproteobacteria bacterium]